MTDTNSQTNGTSAELAPTCMTSVNRIAKLPVVESTIQTAHNIYEKVKDYNSVTNWTLQTAEDTANKAVGIAKPYTDPVMKKLEDPIKKVDGVLCSGLDYVESKVPAVKLPPKELILQIYNTTVQYVTPAVETAKSYVDPAMQTAKDIVGPAVTKTRSVVEPMVENARHKVDEYLHRNQEAPEGQDQAQQTSPQKNETSSGTSSTKETDNNTEEIEIQECEDDRNNSPNSTIDSTF